MNLSYSKSNRNYRGFSKYRKLNFCQVKIASALGGKGEEGIKLKTNFQCKKHWKGKLMCFVRIKYWSKNGKQKKFLKQEFYEKMSAAICVSFDDLCC